MEVEIYKYSNKKINKFNIQVFKHKTFSKLNQLTTVMILSLRNAILYNKISKGIAFNKCLNNTRLYNPKHNNNNNNKHRTQPNILRDKEQVIVMAI